jgi:anthranilate synthase component I
MERTVSTQVTVADGVTPIAVYARVARFGRGTSFLLESAPGAQQTARYSIVGLGALGEVRAVDGAVELRIGESSERFASGDILAACRALLRRLEPPPGAGERWGRFLGAYGAAAFEFAGYLERLPRLARAADPMPDLHLVVPEALIVFDHFTHEAATLVSSLAEDRRLLDDALRGALEGAEIAPLRPSTNCSISLDVPGAGPRLGFRDAVDRAKESIVAGDVFQVVLSQRWAVDADVGPFDAYRALRAINPSPYMYFLDLGWGPLFGSSPEALVRLDGTSARLRPLAGTRPRDADPEADRRAARRLVRDAKERAEHVMLVDLGRNDLGRACATGTVRVTDLLSVERFSHVMHIVSEVCGTLRPDRDAFDLFAATFPAGTVSGAPKIRAIELIAELEGVRRGFYAGSVGYFGFDGSMDACITLRSAHHHDGTFHVAAGAGIVADSDPAAEDRECAHKAAAVFASLRQSHAPLAGASS